MANASFWLAVGTVHVRKMDLSFICIFLVNYLHFFSALYVYGTTQE